MKRSIAVVVSLSALAAVALVAEPSSAQTLKAEQVLEIYHTRGLPPTVAPPIRKILSQVVAALEQGDGDRALAIWKSLWERYPTQFSAGDRARMRRWVLYRAFLTEGKPLHAVLAPWEQQHKTPAAQQAAIPDLQAAMSDAAQAVQTMSAISRQMHDIAKAIIQNIRA